MSSNGSSNGRARLDDGKVRVAIIGVGNCANSLLQGREYYKDARGGRVRPRPHAREPRRLPRPRHRVHGRIRRRQGQGRRGPRRRDVGPPEQHDQVRRRREDRHQGLARHDARRHRQVPVGDRREGAGPTDDIVGILKETKTDVVVNYLPVGSEMATKWYAEQILEAGCAMVNCMPVFIAREDVLEQALPGRGRADHRRRHQVAGGRDDHASRADVALPRARHPPRQDDAAERRRQLRLPQHARARAPRVEEDLEDERRHVDARLRHRRGATCTSARPTT